MNKITIDLENCYGIGKLKCEFDFTRTSVHAVYAPNGIMKTSFARTLRDVSNAEVSSDQVFRQRITKRVIQDELGADLQPQQILVIPPYEESYQPREVSTLLVEASLKEKYDNAVAEIENRKKALLAALKSRSGLTGKNTTPETELEKCFNTSDLLDALDKMTEVTLSADADLAYINYNVIFGEKSVQFLTSPNALTELEAYVKHFDELVSQSSILTPQFTHTNANAIQKSLLDGHFFEANHWITLNEGATPVEIKSANELKDRVEVEIRRILSDDKLHKTFEAFDKKIASNAELRELRSYLRDNQNLIPRLSKLSSFREDVWASLLQKEHHLLTELHNQYKIGRKVIEEVIQQAQIQATDWAAVVDLFNQRFSVPFRLRVENQADVILKAKAPRILFDFCDGEATTTLSSSKDLLVALSQGERRALYLLNVIFELEIRQRPNAKTLVIVDDIADSFDYRNKYAIIEYLQDVSRSATFRLILLSHNFDFHRSVSSRIGIDRQNRRIATRNGREITLVAEKYQKNPLKHWQDNSGDINNFIASIPFVRNLAEYCAHGDALNALTELLHIKANTRTVTLAEIDAEYAKVINNYVIPASPSRNLLYWDQLTLAANTIAANGNAHAELESKLVLSIFIRLKAEDHMINRISDPTFVSSILSNQTNELLEKYRALFATAPELKVLGQVQLMTPENLHVNSFMFEPIIDLGIDHLRALYSSVLSL